MCDMLLQHTLLNQLVLILLPVNLWFEKPHCLFCRCIIEIFEYFQTSCLFCYFYKKCLQMHCAAETPQLQQDVVNPKVKCV